MNEIEERLLNSDFIKADDNYISDGIILVNKKFISNKFLKEYKTDNKNIMKDIPYEKGEEICFNKGSYCKLSGNYKISIVIDEYNSADYDIVKLFYESYKWEFIFFTVQDLIKETEKYKLIKVFSCDEEFIGCFPSMYEGKNDQFAL